MGDDLVALGGFTDYIKPPRRQLRSRVQAVAYLMGHYS